MNFISNSLFEQNVFYVLFNCGFVYHTVTGRTRSSNATSSLLNILSSNSIFSWLADHHALCMSYHPYSMSIFSPKSATKKVLIHYIWYIYVYITKLRNTLVFNWSNKTGSKNTKPEKVRPKLQNWVIIMNH